MKFEYTTAIIDSREMEHCNNLLSEQLNRWGKDGWDLVSSFACPYIGSSPYSLIGIAQKTTFILKRQIPNPEKFGEKEASK